MIKDLLKFSAFLKGHWPAFFFASVMLVISAIFTSAMTGMVAPLMNDVLTDQADPDPSATEKLFDYEKHLERINETLERFDLELPKPKVVEGGTLMDPFSWGLLVFIIFTLQAVFEYLGTFTMSRIGLQVVVNLRRDMIDKIMFLPLGFFQKYDTGDLLSRVNADVAKLQNAISIRMGEIIKEMAKFMAFLVVVFILNWKLSLILFLFLPMMAAPIVIISRKLKKYSNRSFTYLGDLIAHIKEVLVGIRIVKGFQKEAHEAKRLDGINQSFYKYALRELVVIAATTPIMSMIGMVIILSFIWYGAGLVQSGAMQSEDLLAYVLFVYSLYQPVKRIARANTEVQQAIGILPRIDELMEMKNPIMDPTQAKLPPGFPTVRDINYQNVVFAYEDERVLDDVSLQLKSGQVVAMVGPSGGGKSTLVNLLPRFYDVSQGSIRINGTDIREMRKEDLRGLFAVVTQDTILFNDSVHNNIAYGMPEVTREAVVTAAKQAFADSFIAELPEGYDTNIGESGGKLSGGQRQRISIARAILKDAPVLILDEATSALDTESEREVQLALENLMADKTTFVIAHRLSTIRKADMIIVMESGKVVQRGAHGELMNQDGLYRKLVQMQEEGLDAL